MDKKLLIYTILGNFSFAILAIYAFVELHVQDSFPVLGIVLFSLATWIIADYIALLHRRSDDNHRLLWIGKATLITTFIIGGMVWATIYFQ
ncbi:MULTISPECIES: hypothetical protein [Thalassobacillus]|uniref:hypothetical protein n=1 Tax=Thalassobacillus TaxID=331971 RepID=UPI000A1CB4DC|nr:hypothetical protein [Thalassobacillus devorans]